VKTKTRSRSSVVWLLIVLQFLLGLGALAGGGSFILAPDGHLLQMPISVLKNTPFPNFLIPGLLLFTFVGIFPIAVAYSLWKQPAWHWPDLLNPFKQFHWSWAASLAAGVAVAIWIIVQIQWIPVGFLHILYLVWGVVLALLTLHPAVRQYCRRSPR